MPKWASSRRKRKQRGSQSFSIQKDGLEHRNECLVPCQCLGVFAPQGRQEWVMGQLSSAAPSRQPDFPLFSSLPPMFLISLLWKLGPRKEGFAPSPGCTELGHKGSDVLFDMLIGLGFGL